MTVQCSVFVYRNFSANILCAPVSDTSAAHTNLIQVPQTVFSAASSASSIHRKPEHVSDQNKT
jgi:hypothetical protein